QLFMSCWRGTSLLLRKQIARTDGTLANTSEGVRRPIFLRENYRVSSVDIQHALDRKIPDLDKVQFFEATAEGTRTNLINAVPASGVYLIDAEFMNPDKIEDKVERENIRKQLKEGGYKAFFQSAHNNELMIEPPDEKVQVVRSSDGAVTWSSIPIWTLK